MEVGRNIANTLSYSPSLGSSLDAFLSATDFLPKEETALKLVFILGIGCSLHAQALAGPPPGGPVGRKHETTSLWLGLCQDPGSHGSMPDFGFLSPPPPHSLLVQVHPTSVASLGSISFLLVPWYLAFFQPCRSSPLPHPTPSGLGTLSPLCPAPTSFQMWHQGPTFLIPSLLLWLLSSWTPFTHSVI